MDTLEIIDTFPDFMDYWGCCRDLPMDVQIERWAQDYLSTWPDLLDMQVEDYREQDIDWRDIAHEKIFPYLAERLPAMQAAHANLLQVGESVYEKALEMLGVTAPAIYVIHVGIGCGAGWVTEFRGKPAILFGLENVAECGWQGRDAIKGLVAHEMGHLVHMAWRKQHQVVMGSCPWWQLYEEGFAQYCEGLILGDHSRHQGHSDPAWLSWCEDNLGWLAVEFLRKVDADESVRPFFGSWFELRGKSQTGYYLGCLAVKRLSEKHSIQEIALLEDPEGVLRPILEKMVLGSR